MKKTNEIRNHEMTTHKLLSYINTFLFILLMLSLFTIFIGPFGTLIGIAIVYFFKELGNYNIKIGSDYIKYKQSQLKAPFFKRLEKSKNITYVQLIIYSILFISLLFTKGVFEQGNWYVLIIILLPIILTVLHLKYLNKIYRLIGENEI